MRKTRKWFSPEKKFTHPDTTTSRELVMDKESKTIFRELEQNKIELQQIFGRTIDIQYETIQFHQKKMLLCYLVSMTDKELINEKIRVPLTISLQNQTICEPKEVFSGLAVKNLSYFHEVVWSIVSGYAVLFVEGSNEFLGIPIEGMAQRAVEESSTQTIIRGPKDAFTESINTNISLIRRRIKNPKLRIEGYHIGNDTHTSVSIAYMDGITNEKIIHEVRNRISAIKTNAIFDSGSLEELIGDKTMTPFPLVYNTERPDTISSQLTSGKVAIFVDGSPFVLSVPAVFTNFFTVSEDYFQPFLMSSFIRMVRYVSFLIALLFPAMFLSVITYHFELIPTPLLVSIASQREHVPFPALVELMMMDLTFEILREAGTRMPRAVGQTVSIVGALVIGQAAVEAGIISNVMVIVVAITAISSFVLPIYSFANSTRLLRFMLTLLGGVLGLYGVFLGLCAIIAHLVSLRSFGIPYLAPMAPFILEDQKDVLVRLPIFKMKDRSLFMNSEAPVKQPNVITPSPPQKEEEP